MVKPLFRYDHGAAEYISRHRDEIKRVIGRSISYDNLLGEEGSYGFVVRTLGSKWVIKITTDRSEVDLWNALLVSREEEEAVGFVRVHQIKQIGDDIGWAIWREEVSPMNVPFAGEDGVILNSMSSIGVELWLAQKNDGKSISRSDISTAFEEANRIARDGKLRSLFFGFPVHPSANAERLTRIIAGGIYLLKSENLQYAARSFLAWARSNVILCDLSSYNMGRLNDGRFVIFDPSHALMVGY